MDELTEDRLRRGIVFALRHRPETYGLQMDRDGWVDVLEIGNVMNQRHHSEITWSRDSVRQLLLEIGLVDRVQFRENLCRSAYGHSTANFDPATAAVPEACLFHGTSYETFTLINCYGLQPMNRRFVQLTTDFAYARDVAINTGESPVILEIECMSAMSLGVKFLSTGTHVWLSTVVPPDCLQPLRT